MKVFVQEYSFTILAITIQNVISACFAMRVVVAFVTRPLVNDAPPMKLVEEKQCVFSRLHFLLTVLARKSYRNLMVV